MATENGAYPSQVYGFQESDQILKIVLENEDLLQLLEHELRGEVYESDEDHPMGGCWIKKYNPIIESEEGISEILRMLRFMGLNKVSLLTNLDSEQINEKLKVFEMKLADLLFLKRKEWGIQKDNLAMTYNMIWSIVEDAYFRAKDGNLVKTLRTVYQKTDYSQEDKSKKSLIDLGKFKNPYG